MSNADPNGDPMPKMDFATSLMDLVAFFLVTPGVLGEQRFVALFKTGGEISNWLRTYWFAQYGPFILPTFSGIAALAILCAVEILFKITISTPVAIAALMVWSFGPAGFILTYGAVANTARPLGLMRTLAIIGAAFFVAARCIGMAEAWARM